MSPDPLVLLSGWLNSETALSSVPSYTSQPTFDSGPLICRCEYSTCRNPRKHFAGEILHGLLLPIPAESWQYGQRHNSTVPPWTCRICDPFLRSGAAGRFSSFATKIPWCSLYGCINHCF